MECGRRRDRRDRADVQPLRDLRDDRTSWHGFSSIDLPEALRDESRKSFAIYLYTHERPAEESAPPNATIYVPELAPSMWQAGRVLDVDDVSQLTNTFNRTRTQLRYLYQREQRFGSEIAALEAALDETRSALRLPLQGYATQRRAVQG